MRHYFILIFFLFFVGANYCYAQNNPIKKEKYKIELSGFTMPATATINGSFKVSGYIKNIGNKPIPPKVLLNFHISTTAGMQPSESLPTYAYSHPSPVLFPGDIIYVEHTVTVDPNSFAANQRNIVTIWPLMEKAEDPNVESIWSGEILIDSGFGNRQIKESMGEKLEPQALVSVYPNPATDLVFLENREKNKDIKYVIAYDLNGKIVLEKSVDLVSNSTETLDLSALVLGKYELTFFDKNGKLVRTQKLIKVE